MIAVRSLLQMFEFVFGCHHRKLSRIFTIRKRTYRVCLECGREFKYSWKTMPSMQSSVVDPARERLNSLKRVVALAH
jgi:hypothetical protein